MDEDLRELWEERAAIRQFLGNLDKPIAEDLATQDVFDIVRRKLHDITNSKVNRESF